MTPLLKMYTLGHEFIPPPIHAGGLRYHGDAPTLCLLQKEGAIESKAYDQVSVFEAAAMFARTEGIIPAPEPSHAIRAAIDEALECKRTGEEKAIMFLLCGHGHFDMKAYDDFMAGRLEASDYSEEAVRESMGRLRELYPWIGSLPY
jgi:tryptophan synthase beta chain